MCAEALPEQLLRGSGLFLQVNAIVLAESTLYFNIANLPFFIRLVLNLLNYRFIAKLKTYEFTVFLKAIVVT